MRWDSSERERDVWFVLLFGFEIGRSVLFFFYFELSWSMISMWLGGGGARFKQEYKIILRVN